MSNRNLVQLRSLLPESWQEILTGDLEEVQLRLEDEAEIYKGLPHYPAPEHTFRAFHYFIPTDLRVVILGQDCYHQPDQAIGLCFGVPTTIKNPPSLVNIEKELGHPLTDSSLEKWAQQGVLLLNSALTVRYSCAGSHLDIWMSYTDQIIKELSGKTSNVVWLLWGNYAKQKASLIVEGRGHHLLQSVHPSPLSANRGGWFGSQPFSKANVFLESIDKTPIAW